MSGNNHWIDRQPASSGSDIGEIVVGVVACVVLGALCVFGTAVAVAWLAAGMP